MLLKLRAVCTKDLDSFVSSPQVIWTVTQRPRLLILHSNHMIKFGRLFMAQIPHSIPKSFPFSTESLNLEVFNSIQVHFLRDRHEPEFFYVIPRLNMICVAVPALRKSCYDIFGLANVELTV